MDHILIRTGWFDIQLPNRMKPLRANILFCSHPLELPIRCEKGYVFDIWEKGDQNRRSADQWLLSHSLRTDELSESRTVCSRCDRQCLCVWEREKNLIYSAFLFSLCRNTSHSKVGMSFREKERKKEAGSEKHPHILDLSLVLFCRPLWKFDSCNERGRDILISFPLTVIFRLLCCSCCYCFSLSLSFYPPIDCCVWCHWWCFSGSMEFGKKRKETDTHTELHRIRGTERGRELLLPFATQAIRESDPHSVDQSLSHTLAACVRVSVIATAIEWKAILLSFPPLLPGDAFSFIPSLSLSLSLYRSCECSAFQFVAVTFSSGPNGNVIEIIGAESRLTHTHTHIDLHPRSHLYEQAEQWDKESHDVGGRDEGEEMDGQEVAQRLGINCSSLCCPILSSRGIVRLSSPRVPPAQRSTAHPLICSQLQQTSHYVTACFVTLPHLAFSVLFLYPAGKIFPHFGSIFPPPSLPHFLSIKIISRVATRMKKADWQLRLKQPDSSPETEGRMRMRGRRRGRGS